MSVMRSFKFFVSNSDHLAPYRNLERVTKKHKASDFFKARNNVKTNFLNPLKHSDDSGAIIQNIIKTNKRQLVVDASLKSANDFPT